MTKPRLAPPPKAVALVYTKKDVPFRDLNSSERQQFERLVDLD